MIIYSIRCSLLRTRYILLLGPYGNIGTCIKNTLSVVDLNDNTAVDLLRSMQHFHSTTILHFHHNYPRESQYLLL